MKRLTLIRGIPGSGKSTLAKELIQIPTPHAIHLEADMYHVNYQGVYDWKPDNVHQAHQWCQKTAEILLFNGESVVVSNTFTRLKEMQFYFDTAKELGVDVEVYRCFNNYGNIHSVPDSVIEDMIDRFEDYPGEIRYYGKPSLIEGLSAA